MNARSLALSTVALSLIIALTGCGRAAHETQSSESYPNAPVIIVSIDTLRADHLPAYGYKGVETPAIDAFRKDAMLFQHAYSHVPLTLPSHVSMLTGLLPPENGVRNNIGFRLDTAKHITIPQLLKAKGYATGAAVSAYVLRGDTGLRGAFDFYDDDINMKANEAAGALQRPGSATAAIAEQWIGARKQEPFFFLLHLFEPHAPYEPAPQFRKYALPYDGEIATADAIFGEFVQKLKSDGVYDRALIVLMSDHGEGLNEHGEDEHGIFLYNEDIHVPLMVKLPSSKHAGLTTSAPVQLTDILPTITAAVGATTPPGANGRSLLATALEPAAPARRIYSESLYGRIHLGWSELRSLVDDKFHYIEAPRPELYAAAEPAETRNVLSGERRVYSSMKSDLAKYDSALPSVGAIDPEEAKNLVSLGYLGSTSASSDSGPHPDPKDRIGELTRMREAGKLEKAGRYDEALTMLRDVTARAPELTDAWITEGKLLELMGRYDEAYTVGKRVIQLSPSLASETTLALANLSLMMAKPDDAIANARVGVKANPGEGHLILGRASLMKQDFAAAESDANEAMKSGNYRAPAMVLLAQIYVRNGNRLNDAAALIDRAEQERVARQQEPVPLLWFVRGDILARMNRIGDAVAAFNQEIALFPRDQQAYANLAAVQLLAGQRSEANRTMERLVAANPSPAAWALAARTFHELGDAQLASAWQKRAAAHGSN